MTYFIRTEQVQASPATKKINVGASTEHDASGMEIIDSDGAVDFLPDGPFKHNFLAMGEDNDGTKVTPGMVDGFIVNAQATKLGQKTTVVVLTLANGFEVVGHSSCVDPTNYDHDLGTKLATQRAKDQVWMVLGFLLQTARNGVVFANTGCAMQPPKDAA